MVVMFGGFEVFTFGAFDVDQELGMMLYPHTPTRLRFPSAVGVLFGDEPHPYSVG